MADPKVSSVPVVVELGKVSKKRIRRLKRGQGRLMYEVDRAVSEVQSRLGDEAKDKVLLPVVVVYRRKRRRRKRRGGLTFPIPFPV